ncbi:MAG TPA: CPBP family intramembrane glutamic endopeptidase [Planctomycetota bacterium]|nr:CPBP family intramembrane glutamic endopeptidase [Planctomycetota bacterium]
MPNPPSPPLSHRPLFWLIAATATIVAVVGALRYAPDALPIATLEITVDRATVLARAAELAQAHGLGPNDARAVATFSNEGTLQTYVELEAGGPAAFRALLVDDEIEPYLWWVRRFVPGDAHEAWIAISPTGTPFAFDVRRDERDPGAALSADEARAIAERGASAAPWSIDLSRYAAHDAGSEVRPGGRTDHTFTYEHRERRIGEAPVRLVLSVAGDRLSGIARRVEVPQAFELRYAAMRTANSLIASAGSIAAVLLFGILGCGLGLVVLVRRRALAGRPALIAGAVVGAGVAAAGLSSLPMSWTGYDTALAPNVFLIQQVLQALQGGLLIAVLAGATALVAEGLGRLAFGGHPQLWGVWSVQAAGSRAVIGRTGGGYLLAAAFFAAELAFQAIAIRSWGWWSPMFPLVDPDLLAAWQPWIVPVATALQAGFVEECVFRAIPLAGAALIGRRLGGKRSERWWIAATLIIQALIFGACHANYPNQPAYARVVELGVPFVLLGLVYLRFGLLPAIVMHVVYDLALMSLPLFVSDTPGIWWQRSAVIAAAAVPLLMVARGLVRRREVPGADAPRNRAWLAPTGEQPEPAPRPTSTRRLPLGVALALGVAGVAAIAWAQRPAAIDGLAIDATAARDIARAALRAEGVDPAQWTETANVADQVDQQHRLIWATAPERHRELTAAGWLNGAQWQVQYAHRDGDEQRRAERWTCMVGADGVVRRLVHTVAEATAGARLDEAAARALAEGALAERLGVAVGELETVSATPTPRPERTDWTFVWADRRQPLAEGDLRLHVALAGDRVTDAGCFVHIPEAWSRAESQRQTVAAVARGIAGLVIALAIGAALVAAIVALARGRSNRRALLLAGAVVLSLGVVGLLLSWPRLDAALAPHLPIASQLLMRVGGSLLGAVASAVMLGLIAAWTMAPGRGIVAGDRRNGLAAGLACAGIATAAAAAAATAPPWPTFDGLDHLFPPLAVLVTDLAGACWLVIAYAGLATACDRLGCEHRPILAGLVALVVGVVLAALAAADAPLIAAGLAVVVAVAAWLGILWGLSRMRAALMTGVAIAATQSLVAAATSGAMPLAVGHAIAALVVVAIGWWITGRLGAPPALAARDP